MMLYVYIILGTIFAVHKLVNKTNEMGDITIVLII
jgi:hypothetical protein